MTIKDLLEERLLVGVKIRIGKNSAKQLICFNLSEGDIITLIEGFFEHDNGLYTETRSGISIWLNNEFESIYCIFGNNLEDFLDSEIID